MKCRNCGNEVKAGAKFCRECGAEIVEETEAPEGNICAECGSLLEEDALFCNNCGHRVSGGDAETETLAVCQSCGARLQDGALFCGECGASLTERRERAPLPVRQSKKKKDGGLIFLVVLLIVVLIGSICVIGYVYHKNNSVNIETPDISTETKTDGEDDEEDDGTESDADRSEDEEYSGDSDDEEFDEDTFEEDGNQEEDYLFPSDSEYITDADLSGKSKDEVAMIRNEIYARHGYIFSNEPYKSYFESQDWYVPNENFNESVFSEIEKTNKDFLVGYEEDKGWR